MPIPRPAPYNKISYRRILAAINRYTMDTLNPSRRQRERRSRG